MSPTEHDLIEPDEPDELDEPDPPPRPTRVSAVALAVWAAVGLAAAFTLAVDKVKMLADPSFEPSCNFNPVLSCGSVITTDQASVFGFPNPYLGLIGFAVIGTLAVLLVAGVAPPRWVLVGAATGSLLGFAFVNWLAFQSLYRIGALCPWCLAVWVVTPLVLIWTASWALGSSRSAALERTGRVLWEGRFLVVGAWYLLVVVLVLERFWSYWRTLG